jgi:hypothetical protein
VVLVHVPSEQIKQVTLALLQLQKSLVSSQFLRLHKVAVETQVAAEAVVAEAEAERQSKQLCISRLLIQQMLQLSTPRVHV